MRNRYSFSEFTKTAYSLILTKLMMPQARLIRRPVYIRGGVFSGGRNLTTGRCCRFDLFSKRKTLLIGDNCEIGDYTHIVALENVTIGNNVLAASKVFISDTSHGCYKGEDVDSPVTSPNERKLVTESVKIGNNVWIGENAVIMAGSVIGDGCIIGAGAVVKGIYPENSMIVGVPAKVIKVYEPSIGCWMKRENGNDQCCNSDVQ